MRVGFVSDFDFYSDGHRLYVNRCLRLFKAIAASVETVVYFGRVTYRADTRDLLPLDMPNLTVINLRSRKRGFLLDAFTIVWRLWQHRLDCDIVVCKLGNLHALLGFLVFKFAGVPVVVFAINDVTLPSGLSPWRWIVTSISNRLCKEMFIRADGRLAMTHTIARHYSKGRCEEFQCYAETSIGNEDLCEVRNDDLNDPVNVLAVGRLVPYKGHRFLIEAVARLVRSGVRVRLCIAGAGPELEHLRNLADEFGVGAAVNFLGFVTNGPRLWAVYRNADIFVHPSLTEALPMALLEAMANGVPVIASSAGGMPDLIAHGTSGLLVKPGDVDELTCAITRLIQDRRLRSELIRGGLDVASKFTVERQTPVLISYLAAVLRQPTTCRRATL